MLTRLSRLSLARFIQKSKHHIKYNMGRFLPGENKAGEAYRSKFISQIQNMTNIFLLSRLLLIKKRDDSVYKENTGSAACIYSNNSNINISTAGRVLWNDVQTSTMPQG